MIIIIDEWGLEVKYDAENHHKIRVKDPRRGIVFIGEARSVECETEYPYAQRHPFAVYPSPLNRHYKIVMDVHEVKQ